MVEASSSGQNVEIAFSKPSYVNIFGDVSYANALTPQEKSFPRTKITNLGNHIKN